jgi:hypothetical protein
VARAREARKGGELDRERKEATRGYLQRLEVELGVLCRRSAAEAERSRGGSGSGRGRRSRQESEGLVHDFHKVQGPLSKLKILTATKVK